MKTVEARDFSQIGLLAAQKAKTLYEANAAEATSELTRMHVDLIKKHPYLLYMQQLPMGGIGAGAAGLAGSALAVKRLFSKFGNRR